MKVLVIDDEQIAMERALQQLRGIACVDDCVGFCDPAKALKWLTANPCDAALMDINMFGMNGLELARRAKNAHPGLKIIFLTGYSEYAVEAFKLHANGYLMKPATSEEIGAELQYAMRGACIPSSGVYAQTFGHFEIFSNGAPIHFARTKSKELMAYLIDRRGAAVTMPEICAALWEDEPFDARMSSTIRNCIADLRRALGEADAGDLLEKHYGTLAVVPENVRCDYYDYLKGDIDAINSYMGEYMAGYAWAEMTTAALVLKTN